MKKIILLTLFLIILSSLFGWGGLAHRIITQQAMENLPDEMQLTNAWKEYIVEHCTDPDWRKDETPGEGERHYIDIDFYDEFNRGEMITVKNKLIEKYGEEVVINQGVLPWAILETYENLVKAFIDADNDNILLYASDLAHYVEDGSQPQHLILNYNGKLSDQRGIHGRYETDMIRQYETEIRNDMKIISAYSIDLNLDFIFDYISDSNSLAPLIFDADLHALKYSQELETQYDDDSDEADNAYGDDYYRIFWFKTKYITQIQLNKAAEILGSLIYSAWLEAGQPQIP